MNNQNRVLIFDMNKQIDRKRFAETYSQQIREVREKHHGDEDSDDSSLLGGYEFDDDGDE
jgi:hypothetical protein